MLTYSTLAMPYLIRIGIRGAPIVVLLWLGVVAHVVLVALLVRARFKNKTSADKKLMKTYHRQALCDPLASEPAIRSQPRSKIRSLSRAALTNGVLPFWFPTPLTVPGASPTASTTFEFA